MMINLNLIFNPKDTKVKYFVRKNVNNNYFKKCACKLEIWKLLELTIFRAKDKKLKLLIEKGSLSALKS